LPDYQVLDLYGKKILLCHGDTLCIDDVKYQQFRRKVHQKWRQKLFLCLPLFIRLKIANKIRAKSQQDKQSKSLTIMDVNTQFTAEKVAEILREYYIEFVKNNTNLLQNASQMILNQSGLATSTYDTQAISNISSLYNYNIVANKSFLKSHLTYLDYIKNKLKGQKDSYLTERVQTKIIVK